jgi:hypothetical protein
MKLDYVKRMRDRTPVRPFQIHLTSGEVLPVDHPESMSVPADEDDLYAAETARIHVLGGEQPFQRHIRQLNHDDDRIAPPRINLHLDREDFDAIDGGGQNTGQHGDE